MNEITFERWAYRELRQIGGGSFNLHRLAARAQQTVDGTKQAPQDQRRLQALLVLYAICAKRTDALQHYVWDLEFGNECLAVERAISGRSIHHLALRGAPLQSVPEAYRDVMGQFAAAHGSLAAKAAAKRALWRETRDIQLKYGLTNAEIYHVLGMNPGNVNAYLKHGVTEKVSLANAQRILDFARAHAEQDIPECASRSTL